MKSRFGAALSPLFPGPHRTNISRAVSAAKPSLTLFRTLASLHFRVNNSQKQLLHSPSSDEDDFLELGAPMTQGAGKLPKLVTQKPELYGKIDPVKKPSSGRTFPAESSFSGKNVIPRVRTSQAVLKVENCNVGSRDTVMAKSGSTRKGFNFVVDVDSETQGNLNELNTSHIAKLNSVTIEDVPSTVDLSHLIEAISIFGEISSASMKTAPNGLHCCDVKFKSEESRRRAVSVGGITVKSFHLPIRPVCVSETVVIRIKNISNKTADATVHSVCMSFGSLEGLARTKEDSVDALYRVKDDSESQSILKKLNDSPTDGHLWSAHLLARDSPNNEDAKYKLGFQISSHLAELKRQVSLRKIDTEDLEHLHSCIVHLEEIPGDSELSY